LINKEIELQQTLGYNKHEERQVTRSFDFKRHNNFAKLSEELDNTQTNLNVAKLEIIKEWFIKVKEATYESFGSDLRIIERLVSALDMLFSSIFKNCESKVNKAQLKLSMANETIK